jgi:hypothetical protein
MTHGIYLSESSGPLSNFFGDAPQMAVADNDSLVATGTLLRNLKAGRSVYIALDNIIHVRDHKTGELRKPKTEIEVEMLGLRFPRNDGPAWLAVRSGRPLALWTTHCSPSGVVVLTGSQLIQQDLSLPIEERVAAMSQRLYACAEVAIRAHPEAWRYWSYLNLMTVNPS